MPRSLALRHLAAVVAAMALLLSACGSDGGAALFAERSGLEAAPAGETGDSADTSPEDAATDTADAEPASDSAAAEATSDAEGSGDAASEPAAPASGRGSRGATAEVTEGAADAASEQTETESPTPDDDADPDDPDPGDTSAENDPSTTDAAEDSEVGSETETPAPAGPCSDPAAPGCDPAAPLRLTATDHVVTVAGAVQPVTINLDGVDGPAEIEFVVSYDPSIVAWTGCDAVAASVSVECSDPGAGQIGVVVATDGSAGPGAVAELEFTAVGGSGTSPVALSGALIDGWERPHVELADGSVTLSFIAARPDPTCTSGCALVSIADLAVAGPGARDFVVVTIDTTDLELFTAAINVTYDPAVVRPVLNEAGQVVCGAPRDSSALIVVCSELRGDGFTLGIVFNDAPEPGPAAEIEFEAVAPGRSPINGEAVFDEDEGIAVEVIPGSVSVQ